MKYRVITFNPNEAPIIKGSAFRSCETALDAARCEARKYSLTRGTCFTSVQFWNAPIQSWIEYVTVYGEHGVISDEHQVA